MAVNDDWVSEAMADGAVVAELLVRLKEARVSSPIKALSAAAAAAPASVAAELPPPRWGIRQPRTRLAFRCEAASPSKGGDSRTNSPMTPLSWSAGTPSSSGTADCYEESDVPARGSSRSKVIVTNDSTSPANKKLKKKKTFAELREEEDLLLKERIHLSKELATLNATFKDERVRNESLKRMKLDFTALKSVAHVTDQQPNKATVIAHGAGAASSLDNGPLMLVPRVAPHNYPSSDVPREPEPAEKQGTCFVLPDLNLMPSEDDLFL